MHQPGYKYIVTCCVILCTHFAQAQSMVIKRASGPIKIDGIPGEDAWSRADSVNQFTQNFPTDTLPALGQTTVKVLYDDRNVYVLGIMYNLEGERSYVTPSLRRDYRGSANDGFTVIFDTFSDRTNAFLFGINPFGVLREGIVANGGSGEDRFSLDWDNKWYGEARQYEDRWVAELAIPFKTLRFVENSESWLVNFYRIDSEYAERSSWAPVQRTFEILNLANIRPMVWEEPTPEPGSNISIIPYLAANTSRNFDEGTVEKLNGSAGLDVKFGVTSGLNLDLTINPDFSQVEVDEQVINLDRFEIFFPERRQFFLENADLFSGFGNSDSRPFFSRRIGVVRDTLTAQNIQNPIPFGARLSGKVNNNLRLGLLSMQAGRDVSNGIPSYNYAMLSLQQKIFSRSNISAFMVNKQTLEKASEYDTDEFSAFNRTAGLEYALASADNVWNGKVFYHQTFEEESASDPFATGLYLNYNIQTWNVELFSQAIGSGFNPEVGFVRRTDIRQLAGTIERFWFPRSGKIQRHGPGFDFDMLGNDSYGFLDWDYNLLYSINFRNTAEYAMRLRRQYTFLFNPFDPSGTSALELPANSDYTNYQVIARFESDARKKFFYQLRTRSGEYFNGHRINLEGTVGYRYQPYGSTSLAFSYNNIRLPDPYASAIHYLLGPRFDFTFSKSIFWTTFLQYNSQVQNLNINSRFQWRFKPVSDIFLVYTDNYFADHEGGFTIGQPRIRAFTFKVTYWINI